jgi:hypothetical protein
MPDGGKAHVCLGIQVRAVGWLGAFGILFRISRVDKEVIGVE